MNRKGIALIISFMVTIVLAILGTGLILRSVTESNAVRIYTASTKTFWAAEAGIAAAIAQLPATTSFINTPLSADNLLLYNTTTTPVEGYSNRWSITSTGRYILNAVTGYKIERTILVTVEKSPGPNSTLVINAIETTGELNIKGSVDINPDGSQQSFSSLSFEAVFGMTKDQVRALADHLYTNPATNQQPINGITWVDLTVDPETGKTYKYVISSNWTGSGLIIVNGNGTDVALDISGGWTFEGVIWVIGKLSISGTPTITGAVFAESSIDVTQTLTGNATINFIEGTRDITFNLVSQGIGTDILSWQEI